MISWIAGTALPLATFVGFFLALVVLSSFPYQRNDAAMQDSCCAQRWLLKHLDATGKPPTPISKEFLDLPERISDTHEP